MSFFKKRSISGSFNNISVMIGISPSADVSRSINATPKVDASDSGNIVTLCIAPDVKWTQIEIKPNGTINVIKMEANHESDGK